MSLFKKPKKTIQRRVFSYGDDHGEEEDMQEDSSDRHKERDHRKSDKKTKDDSKSHKKHSLLSFDDEGKWSLLWVYRTVAVGGLDFNDFVVNSLFSVFFFCLQRKVKCSK